MQSKLAGESKLCSRQRITSTWKICFDYTNHRFCDTSRDLRLQYITRRHVCCKASIEPSCAFFEKSVVPYHAPFCKFGWLMWSLAGTLLFLACCTESCGDWRPSIGNSVSSHRRSRGASRKSTTDALALSSRSPNFDGREFFLYRCVPKVCLWLAMCYNRLLQEIVELSNIKTFQRRLQHALMNFLESGAENWCKHFSRQLRMMPPDVFHTLFRSR